MLEISVTGLGLGLAFLPGRTATEEVVDVEAEAVRVEPEEPQALKGIKAK